MIVFILEPFRNKKKMKFSNDVISGSFPTAIIEENRFYLNAWEASGLQVGCPVYFYGARMNRGLAIREGSEEGSRKNLSLFLHIGSAYNGQMVRKPPLTYAPFP